MWRVVVGVIAALAAPPAVRAQLTDTLQCFRMKDPLALGGSVTVSAQAFGLQAGCKLSSAALFCVPVVATVGSVVARQKGRKVPIVPQPTSGPDPGPRYCYKVRCANAGIPGQFFTDTFGTRTPGGFRASLLCTPAAPGSAPPMVTTTTVVTVTTSTTTTTMAAATTAPVDPLSDLALWAWVTPVVRDRVHVVGEFHRMVEPAADFVAPRFADDVLYEVHIARGPTSLGDVVSYQIQFTTPAPTPIDPADPQRPPGGGKEPYGALAGLAQTYTVTKVVGASGTTLVSGAPVVPPNLGPRTTTSAYPQAYDDAFAATFIRDLQGGTEGRVWAGPRDEGEYRDLGAVTDLLNFRAKGAAQDGHAGFNSLVIVLEIPTARLTASGEVPFGGASDANTLGIWLSTSRRRDTTLIADGTVRGEGPWVQVGRVGFPLLDQLFVGVQDKGRYRRATPATELPTLATYLLNPVLVRDAEAQGFYLTIGLDATPFKFNRTDITDLMNLRNVPTPDAHAITSIGDVLRVDLGVDSSFPNGRPIPGAAPNVEGTDVTDVLLSVVLTKTVAPVSDGVDYNDRIYRSALPWLPLPRESFTQGHGTPTP